MSPSTDLLRARLAATLFCALCIALGLAARTWLEGPWAKYLGVVLWCWVVYGVVSFLAPRLRPLPVAATALIFSWGVEFAQLTPLSGWLSRQSVWLRWVFGETFSYWDLLGSLVAIAAVAGVHLITLTARTRSSVGNPELSVR